MICRRITFICGDLPSDQIAMREDNVSSRRQSENTIDAAIIGRVRAIVIDYEVPPGIALEIPHHYRADLHSDHRLAGRSRHAASDHAASDQCECDVVAGLVSARGASFRGGDWTIDVAPGGNADRVSAWRESSELEIAVLIGDRALRLIVGRRALA